MTPVSRDDLIFLLHRACVLYAASYEDTPDWVRVITGGNTDFMEEVIEIAKDTNTYDETGEI